MLKREENKELFDALCDNFNIKSNSTSFDDPFLSEIKSLKIDNIKSLKGIEKLVNLEYLEIVKLHYLKI